MQKSYDKLGLSLYDPTDMGYEPKWAFGEWRLTKQAYK